MKELTSYLWTEKYRPESISGIILPATVKRTFTRFLKDKQITNLLLFSNSPGTGKTTTAKALCNEMGADVLYINASKDGNIDTLRSEISKFATVKSLSGNPKVVILDESEGTSNSFQAALRAFMEEFHKSCRFILACNYVTKLIEPLRSRCNVQIDFNFMDKKVQNEMKPKIYKRLVGILKNENVTFEENVLKQIIENFYPDIRRMVGLLQQQQIVVGDINSSIFEIQKVDQELFDYVINKDLTNARRYIIEKSCNYSELYTVFFKSFVPLIPKEKQAPAILILAQYSFWNGQVVDQELNFSACLLEIMNILYS